MGARSVASKLRGKRVAGFPRSSASGSVVSADLTSGFHFQMTPPVVSRRSWQLADLSRTVDDTMLALEYNRLGLRAAPPQNERLTLQKDMAQIIEALLELLVDGEHDLPVKLSSESVVVPGSIVMALRRDATGDTRLRQRLERLASELPDADTLDNEQVELLEAIAEAADAEATVSMRPLMRR